MTTCKFISGAVRAGDRSNQRDKDSGQPYGSRASGKIAFSISLDISIELHNSAYQSRFYLSQY